MSDDVPAHVANGPPANGTVRNQQRANAKPQNSRPPAMTADQLRGLVKEFSDWLASAECQAELKKVLPATIKIENFIMAAQTAVLKNPKLLRPDLRPSLMIAIMAAADVGLVPDGKEGALIIRKVWDADAQQSLEQVFWQAMIWGIVKLGRETGAIKAIRANIVFHGEHFRVIQGEQDIIEHEVNPTYVENAHRALASGVDNYGNLLANVDGFMSKVSAAYCIIDDAKGNRTRRWMTGARIVSLMGMSKAKTGPWNSRFVDEMILKAVMLYTTKWIDLDLTSGPARRFQAALLADLEIDFNEEGAERSTHRSEPPRLEAPGMVLDAFEKLHTPQKETVTTETEQSQAPRESQQQGQAEQPPADRKEPPETKAADVSPRAPDAPPTREVADLWLESVTKKIETRITVAEIEALETQADFTRRYAVVKIHHPEVAREVDLRLSSRKLHLEPAGAP